MVKFILQDNYDDDQVDPYHGKQEEQQAPGDLDLPDDLHLDDDNDEGSGDEEKQIEDTGFKFSSTDLSN